MFHQASKHVLCFTACALVFAILCPEECLLNRVLMYVRHLTTPNDVVSIFALIISYIYVLLLNL